MKSSRSTKDGASTGADPYEAHCRSRALHLPTGLWQRLQGQVGRQLSGLIYWPNGDPRLDNSLVRGLALLDEAIDRPPSNLMPLMPVDEKSIACARLVSQQEWGEEGDNFGPAPCEVVRWHLGVVPEHVQGELLDSDATEYLESVAAELSERAGARSRVLKLAERYQEEYIELRRRPRAEAARPIQLACQNVVIGLASIEQDVRFDGLRVADYASCEVPHLAAHEADRALSALILCDAFRNGGTMEVRFGSPRREQPVPPALKRFGRSLGLELGREDPCSISPAEARRLFMAVTPMPYELRERTAALINRGVIAPERLCYTLLAGIWSAAELDYMLATSPRTTDILSGGSDTKDRPARLAESETCRAALMIGTLFRRLSSVDSGAGSAEGIRVFEDSADPISLTILEEHGAVAFSGCAEIPWTDEEDGPASEFIALPRGLPTPEDLISLAAVRARYPDVYTALLVPADMVELLPDEIPVLRCPDRIAELDDAIEKRLRDLRLGRT